MLSKNSLEAKRFNEQGELIRLSFSFTLPRRIHGKKEKMRISLTYSLRFNGFKAVFK